VSGSPRHPVSPAPGASALETLNAAQVAAVLGLLPHREGGYFRETYRSPVVIPTPLGIRSLTTSILYLITLDDPSRFHRLRFDELWFFHAGSPVEMVFLDPLETHMVGPETPQALAPGGRWMAARVAGPAADAEPDSAADQAPIARTPVWALVGCVVSPGFEYDDFEAGQGDDLVAAHPQAADYIRELS
jgi:predicted cupin superfamily sugar epimerase